MSGQGGFQPSRLASLVTETTESRITDMGDPAAQRHLSTGTRNALYQTEAEQSDSIAPFMRKNAEIDAKRRGYAIEPGGSIVRKIVPQEYMEDLPPENEQFGHNQQPGVRLRGPGRPRGGF